MLKPVLSSARWYVINMYHWLRQRRPATRGPVVLFDIRTNHWHRYLHIFILFLLLEGYDVRVRHRWRSIGSWASHDLFRRSARFRLFLGPRRPAKGSWLITDHDVPGPHVRLTADYYALPGTKEAGERLPMPLVDTQYIEGSYDHRPPDARERRQRGVFFFGNMDSAAYARQEVPAVFGCFTRAHLLEFVEARFAARIHHPLTVGAIAVSEGRDIVLAGRQHQYVRPKELLGVLSRFDFFLAPSGVVMPLCHNLIEAMCAGCIPILQHPHLMEPPLRNGVDCLAFRTEEELATILTDFPKFDESTVVAMRMNVLAYYQQHLTPHAVIGRLEKAGSELQVLRMNAELESTRLLQEKLRTAGIKGALPLP